MENKITKILKHLNSDLGKLKSFQICISAIMNNNSSIKILDKTNIKSIVRFAIVVPYRNYIYYILDNNNPAGILKVVKLFNVDDSDNSSDNKIYIGLSGKDRITDFVEFDTIDNDISITFKSIIDNIENTMIYN